MLDFAEIIGVPTTGNSAVAKISSKMLQKQLAEPKPKAGVTERAQIIARSRADLVLVVREKKEEAKKNNASKTKAVKAFIKLYNSGVANPDTYKVLGKVSIKTIYNWDKKLRASRNNYLSLAPQYGQNRGTSSVSQTEKDTLLQILIGPNKHTIGGAIRLAREILSLKGQFFSTSDAALRRWVVNYIKDNYPTWVFGREGDKALDEKCKPFVLRDRNKIEVGDILVADGHPLDFFVINPWTGKPCRAVLVMFLDWHSAYPCGFEIKITEDTQCIQSAFRNAVLNLGKIPTQVLIDNGKAFKSKVFTSDIDLSQAGILGLYGRLGIAVRLARAYNAKDKPVERFFGTFSGWVEKMMPSYCGNSIMNKPANLLRNEKFHKSIHKGIIPTIEQALALVGAGLDFYSRQPHSGLGGRTPQEVFETGKGPGVDKSQLDFMMLSVTLKTVYRNGIRMFGSYYFNDALIGYKRPVTVRYDYRDITSVLVYTEQGECLGRAERQFAIDPLMRDVKSQDEVKRVLKSRSSLTRHVKNEVLIAKGLKQPYAERDWQPIVDAVPALPEIIEKAEIEYEIRNMDSRFHENDNQSDSGQAGMIKEISLHEPIFTEGWRRYEYLLKKKDSGQAGMTDEEEWLEAYKSGAICPGEFEAIYGRERMSNASLEATI